MKFFVESWAPEYGTPTDDGLGTSTVDVDAGAEVAADRWAPISPAASTLSPACIVFVDGVRRVDARVWINGDEGLRQGVCASYAAGAVRCDGRATLVDAVVERGVFCPGAGVDAIVTRHATYHPRPAAMAAFASRSAIRDCTASQSCSGVSPAAGRGW